MQPIDELNKSLFYASREGSAIVKLMTALNFKPSEEGLNLETKDAFLFCAASKGSIKDVLECISKGSNVNARNIDGETPLHISSSLGHKEIVIALISKGADLDAKNNYGNTALRWAAHRGHTSTVLALAAGGADVNVKDIDGNTPLANAAGCSSAEPVLALIAHFSDVNAKNNDGHTPLDIAYFWGHKDVALELISYGAETSYDCEEIKDLKGLTMHEAAAQGGLTGRMLELLREHPSSLPQDAPEALAALAKRHEKHDAAAVIQSFIAT